MKSLIKRIGSQMIRHDLVWKWVRGTLVKGGRYLEEERRHYDQARRRLPEQVVEEGVIQKLCPDLKVMHGVFRGMKYPQVKSVYGPLFPKLLGSYERELQPVLERICGAATATSSTSGARKATTRLAWPCGSPAQPCMLSTSTRKQSGSAARWRR